MRLEKLWLKPSGSQKLNRAEDEEWCSFPSISRQCDDWEGLNSQVPNLLGSSSRERQRFPVLAAGQNHPRIFGKPQNPDYNQTWVSRWNYTLLGADPSVFMALIFTIKTVLKAAGSLAACQGHGVPEDRSWGLLGSVCLEPGFLSIQCRPRIC